MPIQNLEKEREIVVKARERGWSDDKIKQAVLAFREQNPTPVNPLTGSGGFSAEQPEKKGFLRQVGDAIARPIAEVGVSGFNALEASRELLTGDVQGASEDVAKPRTLPFLGSVKPAFTGQETTGEAAKKIVGYGADIGSNIVGGVGVKNIATTGIKGLAKQAATQGLKEGALAGGLSSFGTALQQDKGVADTLKQTAVGTALGGTFGGVLGGTVGATSGVVGKLGLTKKSVQNNAVRDIQKGTDTYSNILGVNKKQLNLIDDFSAQTGESLPQYLVEHGVPLNTSDKGSKFATKEAAKQFKEETMSILEDSLQKVLEPWKGAKTVNLKSLAEKAKASISQDVSLAADTAKKRVQNVNRLIISEIQRHGEIVDLPTANRIKRNFWNLGYDILSKEKAPAARAVGHEIMKSIEETTGETIVKDINKEMAKVLKASDFLERISGDAVRGGRLGSGMTRIVGAVAGSKLGPIGSVAAGEGLVRLMAKLGDVSSLSEKSIARLRKAGVVPKSVKIVAEARKFLENLFETRAATPRIGAGAIQAPESSVANRILSQEEASKVIGGVPAAKPLELPEYRGGYDVSPTPIVTRPPTTFEPRAKIVSKTDTKVPIKDIEKVMNKVESEIEKRIEKYRKEAGLMATNERAGVRSRNVTDAVGEVNFVANDFNLNRAKSDMNRRATGLKKETESLLYENDPEFRSLIDLRDYLLGRNDEVGEVLSANEIDEIMDLLGSMADTSKPPATGKQAIVDELKDGLTKPRKIGPGAMSKDELALAQTLREAKGLSAEDIVKKHPDIQLKRDVQVKDIHGNKSVIDEGEVLTPYELKGNKVLLQDGITYIVSKNQFDNVKGNALSQEAKSFAPELEGLEESVKGKMLAKTEADIKWTGDRDNIVGTLGNRKFGIINEGDGWYVFEENAQLGKKVKNYTEALEEINRYLQSENPVTKYSQYTLPNGENYREVLIKAPNKYERADFNIKEVPTDKHPYHAYRGNELLDRYDTVKEAENAISNHIRDFTKGEDFKSSHWDEPNIIAHLRLNDRTYKGKKVTFMEELQSDWAREGRSKGFSSFDQKAISDFENYHKQLAEKYDINPHQNVAMYGRIKNIPADEIAKYDELSRLSGEAKSGVPNNPNLKNWQELSIKRALKDAVDNNSDYFAWINGDQTSARYNLATYVDEVAWNKSSKPQYAKGVSVRPSNKSSSIDIYLDERGVIQQTDNVDWSGKKLDEVLGKGLADKIMEKESGTLSGEGFKFGGEWANNLYDKQVKSIVEKVTGVKVEMLDMGLPIEKGGTDTVFQQGIKLTPEVVARIKGESIPFKRKLPKATNKPKLPKKK